MRRRFTSFLFYLLISPFLVYGQEIKTRLTSPTDWNSEIIPFPLEFAPNIDFVGFEDIRFAPGWSDPGSEEFWTYHFTWFIEKKEFMTEDFLMQTFNLYYDGLTQAVLQEQSDTTDISDLDNTLSLFIKTQEGFSGKIRVFDSFFTQDYITLNVKVREIICERSNKQMISFDISPKSFHDKIWKLFQQIEITEKCE